MSQGAFRRAVLIRVEQRRIEARLEDDFHRFGLALAHDDHQVTGTEGWADRYPWITCIEAPSALTALEGASLGAHPAALFRHADARLQCTHLFELAALALSEARHGPGERLFEAEVTDPQGGAVTASLFRDGAPALEWRLLNGRITAPAAHAGQEASAFTTRRLTDLPPEEAEALLILRRVVQTAQARQMNVDAFATAAAMGRTPQCYSLQPDAAQRAARVTGMVRDWASRAELAESIVRPRSPEPAPAADRVPARPA